MFSFLTRKLTFFILMALAVSLPYLIHSGGIGNLGETVSKAASSFTSPAENDGTAFPFFISSPSPTAALDGANTPPGASISGPEFNNLQSAFRFSITPDWVMAHWTRVSVLEVNGMRGLRVPLVTGVQIQDLAGSLTYFFDENDQLQRITFRGSTGDPRPVIQLVTQAFSLTPEPEVQAGLYVSRWNGSPTSFMKVESAPVIRAESPHSRYAVRMEVNRPGAYAQVSPEMRQFVATLKPKDGGAWRW